MEIKEGFKSMPSAATPKENDLLRVDSSAFKEHTEKNFISGSDADSYNIDLAYGDGLSNDVQIVDHQTTVLLTPKDEECNVFDCHSIISSRPDWISLDEDNEDAWSTSAIIGHKSRPKPAHFFSKLTCCFCKSKAESFESISNYSQPSQCIAKCAINGGRGGNGASCSAFKSLGGLKSKFKLLQHLKPSKRDANFRSQQIMDNRNFNNGFSAPSRASFASLSHLHKSEFNPAHMFEPEYHHKSNMSELGIAGIGLEPPGLYPTHDTMHRSRSLWNVTHDDYWNRPPPTRPVSMGYVNHIHLHGSKGNLRSESVVGSLSDMDGRKPLGNCLIHGRRAQSVDALNHFQNQRLYKQNLTNFHNSNNCIYRQGIHGFGNLQWSKSSIEQDSDDVRNYQDIPF